MTEGGKDGTTEWRKGVTLYAPAILWRGHKKCDYQTDAGQSDIYRNFAYFCFILIFRDFAGEQDSQKYFS